MEKTAALILTFGALAWSHSRLPIAFEPNRGQAPAGVDFVSRGRDYLLSVQPGRAQWISRHSRVTAILQGARKSAPAEAEAPLPGTINILKGRDASRWVSGIPTYARVRYRQVYRGIDMVYYGNGGRLEYDFILAPGADPRQIRMSFQGARGLRIDSAGDLLIATADGEMRQFMPVIYQEADGVRHQVAGRYLLSGNTVRFAVARYDRARPLIIDPALAWASYFNVGANSVELGEALALDAAGNIYIAGTAIGETGYGDIFFSKLSPDGTKAAYTSIFGGSYDNECHAIAVDSSGNIYLAGETNSPDFPATNAYTAYYPGYTQDAYIAKIDSTGTRLVYSNYIGGTGGDLAVAVALDASKNAYITGFTNSRDFPVTGGGAGGGIDGFITKFDSTGNGVYSTYLGGSGDDYPSAIVADSTGAVYLTGATSSANFPVTNSAFQTLTGGGQDAFATKLTAAGALAFSTYLGGTGDEAGNGIAVDSDSAVYITGKTSSTDFPMLNPLQKTFGGGSGDVFLAKLNAAGGSLVYSTYFGGSGDDLANAIALDPAGNAYVLGSTASSDLPVSDPFQKTLQGPANALLAAFSADGSSLLFSSYLGGTGTGAGADNTLGDYGTSIALSCPTGVVALGVTTSKDFPATAGVVQAAYGGGPSDAFLVSIASGGTPAIATNGVVDAASLAPGPISPGSLITILGSKLALAAQSAASAPWKTTLEGATVTINGTPVPIGAAAPGQLTVQVPYEIGAGNAEVTVALPCGSTVPVSVQVVPAAPYIYQTAAGDAVVQNQDGTTNGPDNPAKAGSTITVSLTGIGPLDNPVPTGAAAPATPASRPTLPAKAKIGDAESTIQSLALAPGQVGKAQAALVVPTLPAGAHSVVITIGDIASNGPKVYIQ